MITFRCEPSFKQVLDEDNRKPSPRPVSRALRRAFSTHGAELPGDALLEVLRPAWAWNIVQTVDGCRRHLYSVAWDRDAYWVWQRTPSGEGVNLFDEPVFALWLPSSDRDAEVFVAQLRVVESIDTVEVVKVKTDKNLTLTQYFRSGRERAKLNDAKQRRKWDYFFRPARHRIGLPQKRQVWHMERRIAEHTRWIGRRKLAMGAITGAALLLAIVLAFNDSSAGLYLLAIAGYFDLRWLLQIRRRFVISRRLSEWIGDFRSEISALEGQVPADVPTDSEIQGWIDDGIRDLSEHAFNNLKLEAQHLMRLDPTLDPLGCHGIPILAWGLIQPASLPGRSNLNPFHLWSLWPGRDLQPRHGTYYLQLIFPMEVQLAVCGFYWDFIRHERRGESFAEYYYRDVVVVRSDTTEEPNPLQPDRQRETITFQLRVTSGDAIMIALTDDTVVQDLNARLKDREETNRQGLAEIARNEADARGIPVSPQTSGEESYGRRLEVAEANLPVTVGRNARDFIRKELLHHKALR